MGRVATIKLYMKDIEEAKDLAYVLHRSEGGLCVRVPSQTLWDASSAIEVTTPDKRYCIYRKKRRWFS